MIKFLKGSRIGINLFKINRYNFSKETLKIPSIAESIEEVTVQNYLKQENDWVEEDDEILEVETHKGNFNIRSTATGSITKFLVDLESEVKIGEDYVTIDTSAEKPAKTEKKQETVEAQKETQPVEQEKKVEKKVVQEQPVQTSQQVTTERLESREKMSRLRKTVASRLKESQNTYAQVTTFQKVDMGEIMELRKQFGERFLKEKGTKLGLMSFFVKACSQALKERPIINSVIDPKSDEIIHRNFVDISVAVSSPKGLVVPVIRDVQNMTFVDVERKLVDLATRGRDGKLSIEEMMGGTFTISNGGVFGSLMSVPIINPPQSAILGMHNINNEPVVRNGEIVARPIMYISLSYDHRLLDGKEGAGFLKRVQDLLNEPRLMLLEF